MANGIRTGDPRGFNKGRSSKFCEGSRFRQTPDEDQRTYRLKRYGNNNKDEDNTGWNDKIDVLKKTTLQIDYVVELTFIQCSRLQSQSPPRYGSGTGSMPFPQAPAGARRILGGWRRSGWLWCCGRSCWWCSRRMTKRSSPAGPAQGRRGASERRQQNRSTPSEAKPGSLCTCGPVLSPAATPRICHRPPDSTRGSLLSSAHPGIDFQADFKDMRWQDVTFHSTTSKRSSDALSFALECWTVRICILRVLAMVLLS